VPFFFSPRCPSFEVPWSWRPPSAKTFFVSPDAPFSPPTLVARFRVFTAPDFSLRWAGFGPRERLSFLPESFCALFLLRGKRFYTFYCVFFFFRLRFAHSHGLELRVVLTVPADPGPSFSSPLVRLFSSSFLWGVYSCRVQVDASPCMPRFLSPAAFSSATFRGFWAPQCDQDMSLFVPSPVLNG